MILRKIEFEDFERQNIFLHHRFEKFLKLKKFKAYYECFADFSGF
jgi:hypothetical protein